MGFFSLTLDPHPPLTCLNLSPGRIGITDRHEVLNWGLGDTFQTNPLICVFSTLLYIPSLSGRRDEAAYARMPVTQQDDLHYSGDLLVNNDPEVWDQSSSGVLISQHFHLGKFF